LWSLLTSLSAASSIFHKDFIDYRAGGGTLQTYLCSDDCYPTCILLTSNVRAEVLTTEFRQTLYQGQSTPYNLKDRLVIFLKYNLYFDCKISERFNSAMNKIADNTQN